ncbi:ceramidase [Apiospora hydei]|uniref:Ceramidase n=1 Tax=Apiospora hydei TaxID=1337664 RepID=A0ABR1V1Y8_9PEZI
MGHHNHDFSGDKYALAGVWGPPTSWANFCEEDYGVTRYTAEFINTLSNIAYADELSMLVLATAILHRLYTVGRSPFAKQAATVFLLSTTTGLAVAYVRSGNVMYHVTIFGAQLTCIWPRTLYQIFAAERAAERRAKRLRQFGKAAVALAVGYALWHIDLEFCDLLRSWRRALGAPWSFVLEFHGWWHVLTAVGAIEYIKLVRELCP